MICESYLTDTAITCASSTFKKLQLYVNMSPPANIITFRLTLTHVTFDLDLHGLCP